MILTKDLSVFNEGSSAHTRITDLRKRFFEIHIVVLNQIVDSGELSITRLFENVWMYPVNASSEWILSYAAYEVIKEQLYFSGGFRADIIIAEDVSESGLVGWYASKKFERPFELHIYEDFLMLHTSVQKNTHFYTSCVLLLYLNMQLMFERKQNFNASQSLLIALNLKKQQNVFLSIIISIYGKILSPLSIFMSGTHSLNSSFSLFPQCMSVRTRMNY